MLSPASVFGWAYGAPTLLYLLLILASQSPAAVASRDEPATRLVVDPADSWTSLNRAEFVRNTRLEEVYAQNNHITSLDTTLALHRRLRELYLNDNEHFQLSTDDVSQLSSKSLQILQLGGCSLSRLDVRSFARLPALRNLLLDRNHLTAVPVDLLNGTSTTVLSLSGNSAYNLPVDRPVLNSSRLLEFRCNRCGITRIYTSTFDLLPALERLELNDNRISMVYPLAFDANLRLAVIRLNANQLSAYPQEAMQTPPLLELCLDGNNFTVSMAINHIKDRYVRNGLRGNCSKVADVGGTGQRFDQLDTFQYPGISDAFIASYLVLVVLVQGVFGAVLLVYLVRNAYVRRARSRSADGQDAEFDYAAGVVNDSQIYRYVK